ncbi:MAG: cysteine--tRNA ligase [Patescibacteria group bacterium]
MLKIYNTLTRKIEVFKPIKKDEVGIYTCGPTVYREVHIGNFRTYIGADLLRRVLIHNGYRVVHIKNITDVGHMRRAGEDDEQVDPIVAEAIAEGKTPQEISEHFTKLYFEDEKKLNILPATHYPKASDHIKEMIAIIKILLDKGLAYEADGNVYFDVKKFKNYGKLSGNTLDKMDQLLKAVRVSVETDKKDSADFALWKKAEKDRLMKWESPWGEGFPGWHIECSAMSIKYLGDSFDIHTGGEDLIFPHHEDEIAQSEGATGARFANYWMHSGFLLIDEEKMSRSKGNIYTIAELAKKDFEPLAFRYLTFMTHYKNKMNFTIDALQGAQTALNKLREFIVQKGVPKGEAEEFENKFYKALSDDLNMPKALGIMWEMIKSDNYTLPNKKASLLRFDEILGLDLHMAQDFLANKKEEKIPGEIIKLMEERNALRKQKRYLLADQWRRKIIKKGYEIEDQKGGRTIVKKI